MNYRPCGMAALDPATLNALLAQVAGAAKQAAEASKRVQTASASSSSTSSDWTKLLAGPPVFEYKNQEEEIRHFKDWSWGLCQYLGAVDSGFTEELESLSKTLDRAMDMSSASSSTRERSGKLYALLAGLLRGRALQTLKAVPSGDGYEGWRQLLLTLRPVTKNRGLAIMAAIMAWPNFQMNSALQPQLVRLEESFDEVKRAGVSVQEEVKVAVLLKCLSGQLRTHVSLQLSEGMSYLELPECLLKWDRAQQRWSHLLPVSSDEVTMEVDRIEQKGKGKKGGSSQKGKGKKGETGKGKGSWTNDTKGKGKQFASHGQQFHSDIRCYRCDGKGHLAKDCRVRLVQDELLADVPASSQSATTTTPTSTRSSHANSGPQTSNRIARVVETVHEESSPVSAVFDIRDNYSSEGSVVRAVQYYIRDPDDDVVIDIRAVVEEVEEDVDLRFEESNSFTTIILVSGADAPIFPPSWLSAGTQVPRDDGPRRLQDAQGHVIPTGGKREVEIFLRDAGGKQICLKERVTISDRVTQPILCCGKLMEQG